MDSFDPILIAAFVQRGHQYWEAAERFGLSEKQVQAICNEYGVSASHKALASIGDIFVLVERLLDCNMQQLLGQRRKGYSFARQIFVDTCRRKRPMMGLVEIGQCLGRVHHSSVITLIITFRRHPERDAWRDRVDDELKRR